jgi:hypothetical protein
MDIRPLGERLAAHKIRRILLPTSNSLPETFEPRHAHWLPSPGVNDNPLQDFVRNSQRWSRDRVPLPRRLRRTLWALIPIELILAIWLATVVTEASPCDGPICTIATLNHHAAALLACGIFCVAGLAGLIPTTRGFAKCNAIEIVGLAIASAAGGVALLGIGALLIAAAIVLILLATFVLASTATSRREMEDARSRTPFPIAVPRGADPPRAHRVEPPN